MFDFTGHPDCDYESDCKDEVVVLRDNVERTSVTAIVHHFRQHPCREDNVVSLQSRDLNERKVKKKPEKHKLEITFVDLRTADKCSSLHDMAANKTIDHKRNANNFNSCFQNHNYQTVTGVILTKHPPH